jgi:hypothetical protein
VPKIKWQNQFVAPGQAYSEANARFSAGGVSVTVDYWVADGFGGWVFRLRRPAGPVQGLPTSEPLVSAPFFAAGDGPLSIRFDADVRSVSIKVISGTVGPFSITVKAFRRDLTKRFDETFASATGSAAQIAIPQGARDIARVTIVPAAPDIDGFFCGSLNVS